jgi:hypothetical protein
MGTRDSPVTDSNDKPLTLAQLLTDPINNEAPKHLLLIEREPHPLKRARPEIRSKAEPRLTNRSSRPPDRMVLKLFTKFSLNASRGRQLTQALSASHQ